jgi:hypothetical protein
MQCEKIVHNVMIIHNVIRIIMSWLKQLRIFLQCSQIDTIVFQNT